MNEMELKPCPFCGGKAKFSLFLCRDTIVCTECPACIVPPIIGAYSKGELAAEWNGRAGQTEHGRWIEVTKHRDENGTILTDYECSECCAMVKDIDAEEIGSERFCYNCGADMREEGADNG